MNCRTLRGFARLLFLGMVCAMTACQSGDDKNEEAPRQAATGTVTWGDLNVGTDPIMLVVNKGSTSGTDDCIVSVIYDAGATLTAGQITLFAPDGVALSNYETPKLTAILTSGTGVTRYSQHITLKRKTAAAATETLFMRVTVTKSGSVYAESCQLVFTP